MLSLARDAFVPKDKANRFVPKRTEERFTLEFIEKKPFREGIVPGFIYFPQMHGYGSVVGIGYDISLRFPFRRWLTTKRSEVYRAAITPNREKTNASIP